MADGDLRTATRRPVRAADLFCGAGGTSTGAERALRAIGREIALTAINHWPIAVETHTRNHPGARHLCTDLEHVKPRDAVPEGVLDLLMASPTCTYHSRARGGRPVNDQQRMDPWHVVRWCTELRVHRLLVENVPEMVGWGPCSIVTGRPIPSRKGEYFRAWCEALRGIGFRLDYRILNCADYGDPTTRQRFFLIGRSDRGALRWPEATHARGGVVDLLSSRRPWRSAAEIIDWSHPGTSIFTRRKQLAPKTLRRILAGAERYAWPDAHCEALRALLAGREPVLDISAEAAAPYLHANAPVGVVMATGAGGVARPLSEPIPTVTAGGDGGARPHFARPIIVHRCNSDGGRNARGLDEPVPTIATRGAGYLAVPLVSSYYGNAQCAAPATDPLATVTTKDRFSIATPVVVQLSNQSSQQKPRSADDPLRTITTARGGDMAVATPFLVPNFGERPGQDPRTHDLRDPLPTVAATGHIQLAEAVVTPAYRIDILYRMLNYRELARGTSFDDEGEVYDFAGTATEITKQIGNAVPGRTAKALVGALCEDLA